MQNCSHILFLGSNWLISWIPWSVIKKLSADSYLSSVPSQPWLLFMWSGIDFRRSGNCNYNKEAYSDSDFSRVILLSRWRWYSIRPCLVPPCMWQQLGCPTAGDVKCASNLHKNGICELNKPWCFPSRRWDAYASASNTGTMCTP